MELKKGTKILLKNHEFEWFDSYGDMKKYIGKILTINYVNGNTYFATKESYRFVWDCECIQKVIE